MVDITDLGRVLTAMAIAADRCDSRATANNTLAYALRAGASKCAEIATEQLSDDGPATLECTNLDGTVDTVPIEPAWIEHTGYKMPNIDEEQHVQIERVNKMRSIGRAGKFYWGMSSVRSMQIIRYRIIDNPEQTG